MDPLTLALASAPAAGGGAAAPATPFHALAAARVSASARLAFDHALARALPALVSPRVATALDRWRDEAWALVAADVEARCLLARRATVEELAVGCAREPTGGVGGALTTRHVVLSVLGAVPWPYAIGKLAAARDGSWGGGGGAGVARIGAVSDDGRPSRRGHGGDGAGATPDTVAMTPAEHPAAARGRMVAGAARLPEDGAFTRAARALARALPPACRAVAELAAMADAAILVAHAYGWTPHASLALWAAGVRLVVAGNLSNAGGSGGAGGDAAGDSAAPRPKEGTGADARASARPSPATDAAPGATFGGATATAVGLARTALIAAVVTLKLAQWVRAGRAERARAGRGYDAATAALPPPAPLPGAPAPPAVDGSVGGVAPLPPPWERGLRAVSAPTTTSPGGYACPLCGAPPARPAAAPSGVVFCEACIVGHLARGSGRCPVTALPCRVEHVRRLFELGG